VTGVIITVPVGSSRASQPRSKRQVG
jgi:hypothetical protein